jgi:hypothetical protein
MFKRSVRKRVKMILQVMVIICYLIKRKIFVGSVDLFPILINFSVFLNLTYIIASIAKLNIIFEYAVGCRN